MMLLRNFRPNEGHVNGTRYVVVDMTESLLLLQSVSGRHQGDQIARPRINCSSGTEDVPIPGFKPIRAFFAMTIDKAQGQSVFGRLGIDVSKPCFSHGQLYVASSRTTNPKNNIIRNENGGREPEILPIKKYFQVQEQELQKHIIPTEMEGSHMRRSSATDSQGTVTSSHWTLGSHCTQ